jgi:hypothetical protein
MPGLILVRFVCLSALLLAGCVRAGGAAPADAGVDQAPSVDGGVDLTPLPDAPLPDAVQLSDAQLPDAAQLPDTAPQVLFVDDFSDNTLDPLSWKYWRLAFAEQGGKLRVLPQPRPGFNYGHSGNGRGAMALTHIGDKSWTDYRLELELSNTGVEASFNPHALPLCYRTANILFRVAEANESWNSPQSTTYTLSLQLNTCGTSITLGNYGLGRSNGCWIPGTGWSATHNGTSTSLLSGGNAKQISTGINRLVVEVKGSRIQAWVRSAGAAAHQLIDVNDTAPGAIGHGGVGVTWGYESLGWIDSVKVTKL